MKFYLKAQCDGREGRELSYGRRRRKKRQDDSKEDIIEDLNVKEMFRVYDNREEIAKGIIKLFSI